MGHQILGKDTNSNFNGNLSWKENSALQQDDLVGRPLAAASMVIVIYPPERLHGA